MRVQSFSYKSQSELSHFLQNPYKIIYVRCWRIYAASYCIHLLSIQLTFCYVSFYESRLKVICAQIDIANANVCKKASLEAI